MKDFDSVLIALIFWGFVLAVVVLPLWLRYRERQQLHETVRAYIARGESIPEEVLAELRTTAEDETRRKFRDGGRAEAAGIVLIFLAGGVMAFGAVLSTVLWGHGENEASLIAGPLVAAGGFIVGMVGGGLLVVGRMFARRAKEARQS